MRPALGRVAQSVTCLAADAYLTADPGFTSSIPGRSHTFVEIDHEIISTVILLPSSEPFKKGCCQLQTKVCARSPSLPLVQACPGKNCGKVNWPSRQAIAVAWDVKQQNEQSICDHHRGVCIIWLKRRSSVIGNTCYFNNNILERFYELLAMDFWEIALLNSSRKKLTLRKLLFLNWQNKMCIWQNATKTRLAKRVSINNH